MAKRKQFTKTDLCVPLVEYSRDVAGVVVIRPSTRVEFGRNATRWRSFDFSHWYGAGVDPITFACQRQIERFLAGQDGAIEATSVTSYCYGGLGDFLDYCALRAAALERELSLADVDRGLIDDYLGHLAGQSLAYISQKNFYTHTKAVLLALGRRGLITLVDAGDAATFPRNPFPNSNRKGKGETALSKRERQAFTVALRQALKPLWADETLVTGELLAYALLTVALYTGRNSAPLLEMGRDCLRAHPKDDTVFLTLWKRRGCNTSKVALRIEAGGGRRLESMPTVRTSVERLIRRVMDLTEPLRAQAPSDIKGRIWLFRSRSPKEAGQVTALSENHLVKAIERLVVEHSLTDNDGVPLRINVSRLRKTFANRIFELTEGDLATTAIALGNTPQVADRNYLASGEDSRRNWQFMGEILVQELLNHTIGATYKETPMGRCSDPVNGQYAPKRGAATCFNFTCCLRCKHYALTGDDLHKLFSFYFRVLAERSRMDKRRWMRDYAHIPRLIDSYIIDEGLRRGTFKASAVEAAREHARSQPHPFWSVDMVSSLEVFA